VVTVDSSTADDDFSGAALVVSGLGDEQSPSKVLGAPAGIRPNGPLGLQDLDDCWRASCLP